jgi:hypothetical protein
MCVYPHRPLAARIISGDLSGPSSVHVGGGIVRIREVSVDPGASGEMQRRRMR